MTQNHLWIETWADAVRALIEACGGPKRVGCELRPDLPADDAGEWLLKTLKSNRREVMSAPQLLTLLAIGRRHNCDLLMAFVADQAGYHEPKPIDLANETARVTEHMSQVMAQMSREMERLQRLQELNGK
ncbi:hypothetical protein [Nevskia sp.]|uniref:hypothetical protein n=1 Tax=Nevskia sp. TaxID=1929292 RepID=UPI0025E94B1C|nr:hypothetical protein [Nevskia sp.]